MFNLIFETSLHENILFISLSSLLLLPSSSVHVPTHPSQIHDSYNHYTHYIRTNLPHTQTHTFALETYINILSAAAAEGLFYLHTLYF